MIVFSFCFGQVFVCEFLNAQAVRFLSINLGVALVMCVSIIAGEMKTFEKSHMYCTKHIH